MTTTFETAKVGDRVWSIIKGWGEIVRIDYDGSSYPLVVKYDRNGFDTFSFGGYVFQTDQNRILFWDELVIEAPAKPIPELALDTKVLVWNGSKHHAVKAHFCCFHDGKAFTYKDGRTSYTYKNSDRHHSSLDRWDNWELAE